jgi:antagonist of KipI
MNLRIIKAGVLDTVQDAGRYGWQHIGINTGGAMDRLSAQVANILVGNPRDEVVLELHFPASSFFFEQSALISLSGADFSATINGDEIPALHPIVVSKFSILQFHKANSGSRVYLAVQGGLDIEKRFDSCSTNLRAGMGGYKGRALQKDDEIRFNRPDKPCDLIGKKEFIVLPWQADINWHQSTGDEIYVLPGHEFSKLAAGERDYLLKETFTISSQSDRMGYHLKGRALAIASPFEILSAGVSFGTVQLLPSGQLIILMADHQTTGGYPRIAHVISAHHHKLAQMKPGDLLRLSLTDLATAERLMMKQEQHLSQLQHACNFRMQQYIDANHRH